MLLQFYTKYKYKFSASSNDMHVPCYRNDGTEFGGSIYQKISDNLETGINLAWTAGNSNTRFGIAAKYKIDDEATCSVSVYFIILSC